jgi:flagellar motility protein MotE (MotC chaperone)
MEELFSSLLFLTFVNGAFALAMVYYAKEIYTVKSQYENMLVSQSSLQNQQTVQNQMLREKADDLDMLIMDIQTKMEEDKYADLAEINNKIRSLELVLENHAKSWTLEQAFEQKVMESIANIKQWMKKMGDDPTLIRGY